VTTYHPKGNNKHFNTMDFYLPLKLVHIFCAIVAIGANMTYGLWLKLGKMNPDHTLFILRGIKRLDDWIANPAYILALLTGHILLYIGSISITTPWVVLGEGLFILQGAIALPFYTPTLRKQIQAGERLGLKSAEFLALEKRAYILGIILTILAIAIVAVMVFKPNFWE
jgi:uncharacterized membrane protein